MSVFDYELYRQRQQEIEVRALVALLKYGTYTKEGTFQKEAEEALYNIAFPELLTKDEDPIVFDGQDHDMELTLQCLGELLEEGIIEEVNRLDGRIGYRVIGDDDEEYNE
jgi:hypothetical protein